MSADPTMTPSASWQTSIACAAVETPTPTRTGMSVTAFNRFAITSADAASAVRSPVTPSKPTPYTNPRERSQMRGRRSSGAVGAASITVSTPASSATAHHGPASSSGRSGRIAAATPTSTSERAKRSWPMWNAML